jgi:deoxyribodipyrimidine photo-lyase
MPNALVWFRHDLRLDDNPALRAALDEGFTPIPVYIDAPDEEGDWAPGGASQAWLHRSLTSLDVELRRRGSRLLVRQGPTEQALQALVRACDATAVFWNRKYEPATQPRDARIKQALREQGVCAESFNGTLLIEPWDIATQQGQPYKVFTPFWRTALTKLRAPPRWAAPSRFPAIDATLEDMSIDSLELQPRLGWDAGFWEAWTPGEAGAHEALDIFIDGALNGYRSDRDRPDRVGTSRISPHLHFGEIAPWRITAELEAARTAANSAEMDGYIRELGWREFAYHLLHHFPQTTTQNLNPRFEHFDWAKVDQEALEAWQRGRTGVPIIDAGLRELWATGYMHNRVRMIVASYLTKHLRYHWLHGARWFWDTLVDADLANNTLGWQWTAGTGADAAPYFRVFNPVTQAEKFDPKGTYIARWVPELAEVPLPLRFAPWQKPDVLAKLAPAYPRHPIVDLAAGRDGALAAYRTSGG